MNGIPIAIEGRPKKLVEGMPSFKPELVEQDVQEGVKIAAKGSVLLSFFILITVLGLFLYLGQIESPAGNA